MISAGTEYTTLWSKEVEFEGELTERREENTPNKLSKLILQSWDLKLRRFWKGEHKWVRYAGTEDMIL